jgi:hypothetical protein
MPQDSFAYDNHHFEHREHPDILRSKVPFATRCGDRASTNPPGAITRDEGNDLRNIIYTTEPRSGRSVYIVFLSKCIQHLGIDDFKDLSGNEAGRNSYRRSQFDDMLHPEIGRAAVEIDKARSYAYH